jgi:hypothetical protein
MSLLTVGQVVHRSAWPAGCTGDPISFRCAALWHPAATVTPNPSLERTSPGKAPWPRASQAYHPSRGQGASPAAAAQLKR